MKKFSKGGSVRNDSRASDTPSRVVKDTEKAKAAFDKDVDGGTDLLKAGAKYNKTMASRYKVAYGDRPSRVTGMKKGGKVKKRCR